MANLQAFVQDNKTITGPDGTPDNAKYKITAVVTDNVSLKSIAIVTVSSMESLKSQLRGVAKAVTDAQEVAALKVNDVIDLTIPPPPDPTPEQAARTAFLDAYNAFKSGYTKVQNGFLAADDKDVVALKTAATTAYQSYYAFVGGVAAGIG